MYLGNFQLFQLILITKTWNDVMIINVPQPGGIMVIWGGGGGGTGWLYC